MIPIIRSPRPSCSKAPFSLPRFFFRKWPAVRNLCRRRPASFGQPIQDFSTDGTGGAARQRDGCEGKRRFWASQQDFRVYEDGRLQKITVCSNREMLR